MPFYEIRNCLEKESIEWKYSKGKVHIKTEKKSKMYSFVKSSFGRPGENWSLTDSNEFLFLSFNLLIIFV